MEKGIMLKFGVIVGLLITLSFIGGCVPGVAPEGGEGIGNWGMILFLALIFGFMYFVIIRPQRKKQKEHQQMVEELHKGDRVITAGGIYGVIENISDESVVIKVESGITMRVAKSSVAGRRER